MSTFRLPSEATLTEQGTYLPPPPRSVALNARGRYTRAGFLAALLLVPNGLLWFGYEHGEDLRTLTAQGRTTTGHVALRG